MKKNSLLKDKVILVVDDEPDVLETITEILDNCRVYTAQDYNGAVELILSYTFDIVILDIMGVDGFKLLKNSVYRGFPTVMFTAHALSPDSLKKSIRLGAVSFLPKEKMAELDVFLEDVVLGGGKSVWNKVFDRLGSFFDERFGPKWKEKEKIFESIEKQLTVSDNRKS